MSKYNFFGRTQLELEILILHQMESLLSKSTNSYRKFDSKIDQQTGTVTLGGAYTGGKASDIFDMAWNSGWVYMEDDQIVPWNVQLEHGLEFIDNLSEDNAHDFLSFVCRGEKWSEGYFGFRVEDGSVKAVVRRLLKVKQDRFGGNLSRVGTEINAKALRANLVRSALLWQKEFGVAPAVTSALSEFDAAILVGMPLEEYSEYMRDKTAVSKGKDFVFKSVRYQIKANRPSGKPGSFVTLVGKATNYDWDQLIWILYNPNYVVQEAWLWHVDAYTRLFDGKKRLSPKDYRQGLKLDVSVLETARF